MITVTLHYKALKQIKHTDIIFILGMFKNNEAFHFMASYAHICLDFKDQA